MTTKAKERKWLSLMKQIENSAAKLLENRYYFREFMKIVDENPNLPENNFFIIWIWENYLLNAGMGVRRLVDKDSRSVSLLLLLEDIRKNPTILSRKRFAALFKNTGFETDYDYINSSFDAIVGEGKGHIDPKDVKKDKENLVRTTDLLKKYVNKQIAHLDKKELKKLPTINDLDDSIDIIEKLVKKYYALLNAASLDELQPVPQMPWREIFKIPWVTS